MNLMNLMGRPLVFVVDLVLLCLSFVVAAFIIVVVVAVKLDLFLWKLFWYQWWCTLSSSERYYYMKYCLKQLWCLQHRYNTNTIQIGGPPTLYGQFVKSPIPNFFFTLRKIMIRGIDTRKLNSFFWLGEWFLVRCFHEIS